MVPDLPEDIARRQSPLPPRLLVHKSPENGSETTRISIRPGIKLVSEPSPDAPVVCARQTTLLPMRRYDLPPHAYSNKRVNSKYDMKPSTWSETVVSTARKTTAPTYPTPYVPHPAEAFDEYPLLRNRTACGRILGTANLASYVVHPKHIPLGNRAGNMGSNGSNGSNGLQAEAKPSSEVGLVGPGNPVVDMEGDWCCCWDDEVQGVYYYNKSTGEATWIPPSKT